jgi:hypothetical protein
MESMMDLEKWGAQELAKLFIREVLRRLFEVARTREISVMLHNQKTAEILADWMYPK